MFYFMKRLVHACLLGFFIISCHASDSGAQNNSSWYNSTKENAAKMFDATKKATETGLVETGKFLNKTGTATKEGFKAFKQSFDKDKDKEQPDYLKKEAYKLCLSVKSTIKGQQFCLSRFKPLLCKDTDYLKLKGFPSLKSCE